MPTVLFAAPELFVLDVVASTQFYAQKLGFSIAFVYGEPPFYGQVFRDGARLNFRHVDEPAIDPAVREAEQLLSATVAVDYADSLFAEYQAADVPFAQTIRSEPWGARTFIVRDPDGNLILFAGREE